MKIVYTDEENLQTSMEFSGKMWLMIILKVTKNQNFTVSLEDTFLEKLWGESQIHPPSPLHQSFKG